MWKCMASVFIICGIAIPASRLIAEAQSVPEKLLVGDVKVETIASYKGPEPLPKPSETLVRDFGVSSDVITIDDSAGARLLGRGPVHRTLDGSSGQDSSPEAAAQHVRASFAKALIAELQKASVSAGRFETVSTAPPDALVISGEFTAINEGNKSKRVMIGFGRGASDVRAHVTVALTTEKLPIVLSEFTLNSESGKKPGAAATMGVGSAGASVATGSMGDRQATVESDASRMGKAVAQQIETLMAKPKWITLQKTEAK
jgi:hypothetical protein